MMKAFLAATAVLYAIGCNGPFPPRGEISDEQLLRWATTRYDKRAFMNTHITLGTHRGQALVVDFPCSDVCPDYTARVVHYILPPGKTCAEVGGVVKAFKVPAGPASHLEEFCFPSAIAQAWARYLRASAMLSHGWWLW